MRKKLFATLGLVFLTALMVTGLGFAKGGSPSPTPQGFEKYLVFTAAGLYDPDVPPVEGDLVDWYHKEVMGRSDAEIASVNAAADAYFEDTFGPGLPPSFPFAVDPRNEYRAYVISGEWVASEGWVVRDGGFLTMLGDDGSGGMTLTGTWGGAGTWVPAGSMLVFGDYNINREGPGNSSGHTTEPLIIHYQSGSPIIQHPYEDGIKFNCTVISEDFGEGLAQGLSNPQTVGGKVQANIRTILTFPGLGPSIEH